MIPLLKGVMVQNLFYFVTRRAILLLPDGVDDMNAMKIMIRT
jgi:hypothetical protein